MPQPSVRNQIFAWSIYDLANTVYYACFITLFFPAFVKVYLGGNESQIGLAIGISTLASAVLVPIVGAMSDQVGRRMPFLVLFTVLCCVAVASVAFSNLYWALILAAVSNFLYSIALVVYDALLPKIAPPGKRGEVSGLGTAVGYLGTHVSLAVAAGVMLFLGWNTEASIRAIFVMTGVLFLGFSLYPFLVIHEPKIVSTRTFGQDVGASFTAIGRTLKRLHRMRGFLAFLLAMFFVSNSIMAIILFLYTFSESELGLTPTQFMKVYAIMAVAAAVGAYLSGRLTDRIGPRAVLFLETTLWIGVVFILMFVHTYVPFVLAGCLGGIALGAHWTASRPQLIQLADPSAMGEYFGFLALVSKASGAVGPAVFGIIADRMGYDWGLWALVAFFGTGLVFLFFVPREGLVKTEAEGTQAVVD